MDDVTMVTCPYCCESMEFYVDPDTSGSYVEDCAVCCRPWRVYVSREHDGSMSVDVDRAQ